MTKQKILLPFKQLDGVSIHADKVSGGIEMFVKQIYENVVDYEIIPVEYTLEDARRRLVKPMILAAINKHKPDLMIVNFDTLTITTNIMNEIDVPIMWIIHNLGDMISKKQFVEKFDIFRSSGNSIYMVSQYQLNTWRKLAKNFKISDELQIDGLINSSFDRFEMPNFLNEKKYDVVTIGRTNPTKDNYFLNRKYKTAKIDIPKTLLITNTPYDEKSKEYQNHNTEHGIFVDVEFNLPYNEVIENLNKSKVLVSSCAREPWGIVMLEALCHGIPVIAVTEAGRGSVHEIAAHESHYMTITKGEKTDSIIEKINLLGNMTVEQRMNICEMTKRKHAKENWLNHFSNCVKMSIEKYENTEIKSDVNTLERFFE